MPLIAAIPSGLTEADLVAGNYTGLKFGSAASGDVTISGLTTGTGYTLRQLGTPSEVVTPAAAAWAKSRIAVTTSHYLTSDPNIASAQQMGDPLVNVDSMWVAVVEPGQDSTDSGLFGVRDPAPTQNSHKGAGLRQNFGNRWQLQGRIIGSNSAAPVEQAVDSLLVGVVNVIIACNRKVSPGVFQLSISQWDAVRGWVRVTNDPVVQPAAFAMDRVLEIFRTDPGVYTNPPYTWEGVASRIALFTSDVLPGDDDVSVRDAVVNATTGAMVDPAALRTLLGAGTCRADLFTLDHFNNLANPFGDVVFTGRSATAFSEAA